jgi:hypothetical protein
MLLEINLHSVVLLVGPANCGKTRFIFDKLIPSLKKNNTSGSVNMMGCDSDKIAKQFIGKKCDKYDERLNHISSMISEKICNDVESFMKFPVKKELIMLDATVQCLNEEFRNNIFELCNEHNYFMDIILFDYENKDDYYIFNDNDNENTTKIIQSHVKKIKNFKNCKKSYHRLQTIKSHPFKLAENEFNTVINNYELYSKCIDNNDTCNENNYFVIGDIHGCIDEFKQLLLLNGFDITENDIICLTEKTKNYKILLVGDYVDKGPINKINETIEFIHKNISTGLLIIINGNHEVQTHKMLVSENPLTENREYYTTYFGLKNNEDLKNKFLDIYNMSIPFFCVDRTYGTYYITHSPCDYKYIGKVDLKSIKKQNYTLLSKDRKAGENILSLMNKDSHCYPIHIFGHASFEKVYIGRKDKNNIIAIDTGCVYGNKLTGYTICEGSYGANNIKSVEFMNLFEPEKITLETICKQKVIIKKNKIIDNKIIDDKGEFDDVLSKKYILNKFVIFLAKMFMDILKYFTGYDILCNKNQNEDNK